jgi:hypothetical protein
MFKGIRSRWHSINENFSLVDMRIGDVLFTPRKRDAITYNENFPNNLVWAEDQDKLRKEILNGGYDPTNQDRPISVSKNGVCVNGHHRLTSLLKYYGEDYVVRMRKLEVNYRYIIWLSLLTSIFDPKFLKSE